MKNQARYEILYEEMNSRLMGIGEGVVALSGMPQDIATIKEDIIELKTMVGVMTPIVKEHEQRINRLEATASSLQP